MEYLIGIVALVQTFGFAFSALTTSTSFATKSRVEIGFSALDSAVFLLFAHVLLPWGSISSSWWLLPVTVFAAGTAGLVSRWNALPWIRPARGKAMAILWGIVHGLILAGALFLVLG